MPVYPYLCKKCGEIEIVHSIHDDAWDKCPECGTKGMQRQISLSVNLQRPKDMFWENMNGGRGNYIGGLGRRNDPKAYCRSLSEATEKAKRMGKSYELG